MVYHKVYCKVYHIVIWKRDHFQKKIGFADSLNIFKKLFIDRKGPGRYILHNLAKDFIASDKKFSEIFHKVVRDNIRSFMCLLLPDF